VKNSTYRVRSCLDQRRRHNARDSISSTSFCRPSFSSFGVIIKIRARVRLNGRGITVYHARARPPVLVPHAYMCTLTLQFVAPFPRGGWSSGLATWKCCLEKPDDDSTSPVSCINGWIALRKSRCIIEYWYKYIWCSIQFVCYLSKISYY